MRMVPLFAIVLAATAVAAPRLASQDAVRHRGERVTLVGPVSAVESRPDGAVLMIGKDFPVPVRVPEAARGRLGHDLGGLKGRELQVTGTLSPADQPLELILDHPEQLATSSDDVTTLRERVHELEDEVARLRAVAAPPEAQTGIVYGPTPRTSGLNIPRYATQATVLAERGVPSRMGWGPHGRVLYYGRERWTFDENGQLLAVDRDH